MERKRSREIERKEKKEEEGEKKRGNLNQILNGLQISCISLPDCCGTECKCKSIQKSV